MEIHFYFSIIWPTTPHYKYCCLSWYNFLQRILTRMTWSDMTFECENSWHFLSSRSTFLPTKLFHLLIFFANLSLSLSIKWIILSSVGNKVHPIFFFLFLFCVVQFVPPVSAFWSWCQIHFCPYHRWLQVEKIQIKPKKIFRIFV